MAALLKGARDFVCPPLDLVPQLQQALDRLERDKGSPAAMMEQLVGYYELGQMVVRQRLTTPERVEAAREAVQAGQAPNLFEALRRPRRP